MATLYKIRQGFSFVVEYGVVKGGGETIELEDDVYQLHAHKLELVTPDAPVQDSQSVSKVKSKSAAVDQSADATDAMAAAPEQLA